MEAVLDKNMMYAEGVLDQNVTYLYLSSSDSNDTPVDFIVDLPQPLQLDEYWEIALLNINRNNVIVYCDWCKESTINGSLLPVLRKMGHQINYPHHVSIHPGYKARVHIYIKDHFHNNLSFIDQPLMCTLQLKRCR
jgi:hypothetical protein